VIIRSTRFAIPQNQPAYVDEILQDVGNQERIAKGQNIQCRWKDDSLDLPSGSRAESRSHAEGCFACHRSERTLEHLLSRDKWRIFTAADGTRMLGSMEAIRNEPTCSSASCQVHNTDQAILGV
jgi:two-component system NtrC family sensor kinase